MTGEPRTTEKLRRLRVRCRSRPDAPTASASREAATMRGRVRIRFACLSLAVMAAALLMGSAAANLQDGGGVRDEREITVLKKLGLANDAAPLTAEEERAPSPLPGLAAAVPDFSSFSFSSSSSSSGSGSEDEIVARVPIDALTFAVSDGSVLSGSGSQAASSAGSGGENASIAFPTAVVNSQSSSGSGSEAGASDVVVPSSTSSSESSDSEQAHDKVVFLSTSNSGDMDAGLVDSNATSSSASSSSGSGSSVLNDTIVLAADAALDRNFVADKQDAETTQDSYVRTITPVAKGEQLASALTAAGSSDAETITSTSESSTSSSSGSGSTSETDAPQMHGVPSNPTLVSAVAHDGRAEVSWKTPDDDGADPITEYEVSWFDEEGNVLVGTQVVAQIAGSLTATKNSTSSTVTSATNASSLPTSTIVSHLLNGKSYTFKVRARNVNGFSVWSAKSLAVSPLHPPDLCGRISCSGRGTCFPNYHQERSSTSTSRLVKRSVKSADPMDSADDVTSSLDAQCICRPGFRPPDCSVKDEKAQFVWKVSEWTSCSSGCGGGKRTREATCLDLATDKPASAETLCTDKKPSLTGICNGMECGSKLVSVKYEVEMSYDEVLFSPEAVEAFEVAFTTEVSAALQIPRTRLEVTALKRGSIAVFFQILPASRVGEKSLNDIVERLQDELDNATSTLRSKGTFARRVEPNGVKLSFSLADQSVQGGAEDISILGLIGTVLVLCFFVFMFGWSLRKRHQRILKQEDERRHPERVLEATKSEMKRMGIRTMA